MNFTIISENEREIAYKIAGFFQARGVKNREQLEANFDCLMKEFAGLNNGSYDEKKKVIRIGG